MFLTIPCPGCNVSLKKPANLPAGKRIQCPHCGTAFAPTAETDAAQGVTTTFHPSADTSPAASPPTRRTSSSGSRGSAPRPPKRISTGAVLAAVALVVAVLLGGSALAVLAYFGSTWTVPSKSTRSVADQQPTMPNMGKQPMQPPFGAGPGGPGIFGPAPVGPRPVEPRPGGPVQPPRVTLPAAERGRPRWLASEQQLNQLAAESDVGAYRMRLPRDFAAQKPEPREGTQTWLWKHSTVFKGATRIEVALGPAADEKPDDAIEKVLAGLPCLRQGWSCTMVQRGEVNGLLVHRVKWSGFERGGKRPISGFVYAALDGDTLIRIAGQTTEPNGTALLLLDAAALTFRKAPK
jgi:hypothetical protein